MLTIARYQRKDYQPQVIRCSDMKHVKTRIFVETIDPYESEMLVMVGQTDKKEVYRYLKKIGANVGFTKWVLTDFDDWKEDMKKKNKGQFCWNDNVGGTGKYGVVLLLRAFEDSWDYWGVLIHELHHAVQRLASQKGFLNEPENQAYLQEHLFRSIRRKLQGPDPIEKP